MKNILLIANREIKVRIRKKTFLLMTLLGPLGMLFILIVPYWLSSDTSQKVQNINVIDQTGKFSTFPDKIGNYNFSISNELSQNSDSEYLIISHGSPVEITLIGNAITANLKDIVRYYVYSELESQKNVSTASIDDIKITVSSDQETAISSGLKMFISYGTSVIIYFFIFLYGIQIMKGIIEEKANRIVEVMLTTVKPFEMMMGKILGLGTLGLIQFSFWLVSSLSISYLGYSYFQIEAYSNFEVINMLHETKGIDLNFLLELNRLSHTIQELNIPFIIINFVIFFILGFLIYASLFAIAGAASDIDTDTQQFLFPITIPLITSMILIQPIINNPDNNLGNILSLIPFSAPIITCARVPFMSYIDHFYLKWLLCVIMSFGGFLVLTYLASRIYRVGIMRYGTKHSYKEVFNWIFFKQ